MRSSTVDAVLVYHYDAQKIYCNDFFANMWISFLFFPENIFLNELHFVFCIDSCFFFYDFFYFLGEGNYF